MMSLMWPALYFCLAWIELFYILLPAKRGTVCILLLLKLRSSKSVANIFLPLYHSGIIFKSSPSSVS